ncbi:MAG TPA: acyl-CoA thioesterase [Mycobacteriales bacterium]|nr:acyl-CoA thioesterase [Mycobacteriales bacterium]
MTYVYRPPSGPVSLDPKPTSASRTSLARIMTLHDTNLHGNVHGGVILHLVDELGGAVAARHSGGRAVTASMDEFQFLVPVHVGDLVRASATVNWAGRTSMEVGVRVEAERWDEAGQEPRHVASAYVVYVALDEDGRPREVPPVVPETAEERRRVREAEIRRAARLTRRQEIQRLRAARDDV